MTTTGRTASAAGAVMLGGLSALHLSWAAGSAWPAADPGRLAELVAGSDELPAPSACAVVGVGLGAAAALVAGAGGGSPVARWSRRAVAAGFLGRGVLGLTGRTHVLVPWSPAATFVRLDRRYYGPLCLAIAATAWAAARRPMQTGQARAG